MRGNAKNVAWLPIGAALLLAGCASDKTGRGTPPKRPPTSTPAPPAGVVSAAEFVSVSGSIDLLVIRASEFAAQRSQALRVREVAGRLISSHRGTSQQLSFAGRRLNLLPDDTMRPQEQARLDRLSAAADFDATFRNEMKAAIEQQMAMSKLFAKYGASPTLRPVAAMVAEADERDLRLLGYL